MRSCVMERYLKAWRHEADDHAPLKVWMISFEVLSKFDSDVERDDRE